LLSTSAAPAISDLVNVSLRLPLSIAALSIPGALSSDASKDMCQVDNNICDSKGHLVKLSLGGADFVCPDFPKEFAAFERLDTLDVAFNSFGEDTLENVAKVN
jgi:hypothetical protein